LPTPRHAKKYMVFLVVWIHHLQGRIGAEAPKSAPFTFPVCRGFAHDKEPLDPIKIIKSIDAAKYLRNQAECSSANQAFANLHDSEDSSGDEPKQEHKVAVPVKRTTLYSAKVRVDIVDMMLERMENDALHARRGVEVARTLIPDAATQRNMQEMMAMVISTTLIVMTAGALDISSFVTVAPILALGFHSHDTLTKTCRLLWMIFLISGCPFHELLNPNRPFRSALRE